MAASLTSPPPASPPLSTPPTSDTTPLPLGKIKVTAATPPGHASAKPRRGGRHTKPSLTVSSTLLLGPEAGAWQTATSLCDASKRGDVFIAKAGSCEVGFEVRVDGGVVSTAAAAAGDAMELAGGMEGVDVGEVLRLAGECAVWGDVGLVLKAKHGGEEEEGRVAFFLHHKDLASEMVKVAGGRVEVVEFRGVEVVLEFCSGRRVGGKGKKKKGKGRKVPMVVDKPKTSGRGAGRYALRPRRDTEEEEDNGTEEIPERYAWSIHEMAILVDVGLRRLLGVGRGPQGFRTSKSGPAPSLMEIAPGVWNLRYLQSLEAHARAIPAIASGIARLANARSTRLREKVARLGLSKGPAGNNIDQVNCGERVEEEVRGRLWTLCQTKIQADPMAKTANNTRKAAAAVKDGPTYKSSHLPLALYGESTDNMGGFEEYFDDHDGQVVLFEASRDEPCHLQLDLDDGVDTGFIYNPHVHLDMFYDVPGDIMGTYETNTSYNDSLWMTFGTRHGKPWARREPDDFLLEDAPGTNTVVYHTSEEGFLEGEDGDFEFSQEDHRLTTANNHPLTMRLTSDCFQDDGYQYHHAVEFIEDDIADDEDMEEEEEGFIYTDGQGNCYTFEPHDRIPHEAGFPEHVHHLAFLQHAQIEEEHHRWLHEC